MTHRRDNVNPRKAVTRVAKKPPRLSGRLEKWATQQVLSENARLVATVASLRNDVAWANARCQLATGASSATDHENDPLACVRMVQDVGGPMGGFPHQYLPGDGGGEDGEDGDGATMRFVCARKTVKISGCLESTRGLGGSLVAASPPPLVSGATVPLNASAFGPEGVLYSLVIVNVSSGAQYTSSCYPGIGDGGPFVEWPNGDRVRDYFRIGPGESRWTVRFRFPHVSRERKDRPEWCFRFTPHEESLRQRYPALTFETASFHACARVKGE